MNNLKIICAYCKVSKGIGYQGKLPWENIKEDMEHFKKITTRTKDINKKNAVIMGKNTWLSINHELPNRINIIISKTLENKDNVFKSLEDAFIWISKRDDIESIFIIGGYQLYKEVINRCRIIYITEINKEYKVDTYFPDIPKYYECVKEEKINNIITFKKYENKLEEYQYLDSLYYILKNGEFTNDRTGIGTLSVFDMNFKYTIDTYEENNKIYYKIPIITTKKIFLKAVIYELIWFLRGETNVKWLQNKNIHIWDGNSSKEYLKSIGLDYKDGEIGPIYGYQWTNWGGTGINQIKNIINELRNNPTSRRIILSAWNVSDLYKMALPPCHLLYMFKVSNKKLNCKVILRSNDMFLGHPFNLTSTALLTILISKAVNILPGQISLSINDAHIYINHINQVKEQLKRYPYEFPSISINKQIKEWEDMKELLYEDFEIINYKSWEKIKADMAV